MRTLGVLLVTLTAIAVSLTYTNHAPLIPLLQQEFALSDVEAGLFTTALFLVSIPAYVGGGGWPERFGARRLNALDIGLVLAGNALFGLAPDYAWLLAGKALSGIGSGIAFNASLSYVAALYARGAESTGDEGSRSRGDDAPRAKRAGEARSHFGLGVLGAGYPLGSALAIWLMPPLALAFGWRGAFHASTVALAIALALWLLAPRAVSTRARGTAFDAFRCANCWWTSLQHAAGFGLGMAAGTWITVYLLREFGLPLDLAALFGGLLLALTVVARPMGGFLLSREHLPSRVVMRIAQLVILGGLAALALPGRPLPLALLGTLAVGFGAGLPYSAVFNTAAASLPRAPGSAQGFAAVGGTVGALVGAPAIGYALQTWGFAAAWALLGAVSLTGLVGTFLMRGEEEA